MKRILSVLITTVIVLSLIPLCAAGADDDIVLGVNGINTSGAEGHSLIWTGTYKTASSGFSWWRSVTFEWSDEAEAYVITTINTLANGSDTKNNIIPKNGFALIVNIGNDYGNINYINKLSSDTYYNIEKLSVGDKAYLVGIDLANGTIEASDKKHWDKSYTSDAKIYINQKPSGKSVYTPDTSAPILASVNLKCEETVAISDGITFSWDEVEGAENYYVSVNNSTVITDGDFVVKNQKVTATEFTVAKSKLNAGSKYTVSVVAKGKNVRDSFTARKTVKVLSDEAMTSPFIGKNVITFGDSITAFGGWTQMLGGKIGVDIINAGVGGNTTNDALERIDDDVIAKNPDVVLVLFGMNDQAVNLGTGKSLVSIEKYEENYRTIIEKIHSAGAEVVLMTGNNVCTASGYYSKGEYNLDYGTGAILDYYEVIRKLAKEYNLNLVDINKIISDEKVKDSAIAAPGDGIHLSNTGKAKFAEWIADYMLNDYFEGGYTGLPEELIPSDEATDTDAILGRIECGTKVSDIKALFENSNVTVKNKDTEINDTEKVGTGYTVGLKFSDGIKDEHTVIVIGDVSGDARIAESDKNALAEHIMKIKTLDGIYKTAADIDGNGIINVTDVVAITLYIG